MWENLAKAMAKEFYTAVKEKEEYKRLYRSLGKRVNDQYGLHNLGKFAERVLAGEHDVPLEKE